MWHFSHPQANSNGMTPILIAVSQNHFDLVDFLLGTFGDQLPGIVNNKVGGATVFHYAAAVGKEGQCLKSLRIHVIDQSQLFAVPLTLLKNMGYGSYICGLWTAIHVYKVCDVTHCLNSTFQRLTLYVFFFFLLCCCLACV